ncbi:hypothetical protein Acr_08g0000330 [Actinidia rufa]|uniref:Uncharacterized protein n=1 Tax=Actinidia rufa TaxID=165716 RepID=A0A7J0F181_9ERIC|nr:hypothetical protein Acr_08g0000330 [Actinidia rufa]
MVGGWRQNVGGGKGLGLDGSTAELALRGRCHRWIDLQSEREEEEALVSIDPFNSVNALEMDRGLHSLIDPCTLLSLSIASSLSCSCSLCFRKVSNIKMKKWQRQKCNSNFFGQLGMDWWSLHSRPKEGDQIGDPCIVAAVDFNSFK